VYGAAARPEQRQTEPPPVKWHCAQWWNTFSPENAGREPARHRVVPDRAPHRHLKALWVVADHQPPPMRRERARRRPEAAGHPLPPLSNRSGCGGGPPATRISLCGCLPRGNARSPPTPAPPPEALKQCREACHLKISVCMWDQPARAISFNRPPLFRGSVSVVDGPPRPSHRMVVMAPRETSIVPTPRGPQEPRSGVTRRERSPLYACLSYMSDAVPRGPQ